MKLILFLFIVCGLILTSPAIASKYGGAGNGQGDKTQKQIYEENQQQVSGVEEGNLERNRERVMEQDPKAKKKKLKKMKESKTADGMERQREQKSMQEQKELGKGSEQGQQAREKRKKWWKFWGGDEAAQ